MNKLSPMSQLKNSFKWCAQKNIMNNPTINTRRLKCFKFSSLTFEAIFKFFSLVLSLQGRNYGTMHFYPSKGFPEDNDIYSDLWKGTMSLNCTSGFEMFRNLFLLLLNIHNNSTTINESKDILFLFYF